MLLPMFRQIVDGFIQKGQLCSQWARLFEKVNVRGQRKERKRREFIVSGAQTLHNIKQFSIIFRMALN